MNEKLLKPYDPHSIEAEIYTLWENSGFFNPDNSPTTEAKSFSIVMPPTNANGSLHAGHAMVIAIEDIMTRFKRMQGYKALWLPGLDHAGFETQIVYEKELEKNGRSRFGMKSDDLYKEILDFTLQNSKNIKGQVRSLGASCDWSRERFTLDPIIVNTVYRTFKKLEDDDLLYRGKKIISWCPKHQTSFSDLEIENVERKDRLYYLKYGPFTIATTRPETKFGDKYVVVHPDDTRYASYKHGETLSLEWINGPTTATIVKDASIDMSFGTGVMTITPWHDNTDFEIAERHNLEKVQIINEEGKLLPIAGEFAGMKIAPAREKIIEKLATKGLVDKIDENYTHSVKTCYKCGTVIEPQIQSQWFVKMKPLAEAALKKIENNDIIYIPDHYKKISTHWLNNIVDWNISRQIAWGIKIPAKICDICDKGFVDINDILVKCPTCDGQLREDKDTFDTWFSSSQWPFATLGYPDHSDYITYYPTDILETAGEIIFFWVTRMIMLGIYVTGNIPFKTVYLHGLVLDGKGQKMSKSKGNVINPLDLTKTFGTDALRMALIVGNTPGTSLSLSPDKIKAYKHFANKIWNASRFVLSNTTDGKNIQKPSLTREDENKILEMNRVFNDITYDMEEYRFYLAAEKIYHYFWHTFADIIIEESKKTFSGGTDEEKVSIKYTLFYILENSLRILHPFMPFITEEVWSMLPNRKNLLIVEKWPGS
jgi:valyl-tRNA synthetase